MARVSSVVAVICLLVAVAQAGVSPPSPDKNPPPMEAAVNVAEGTARRSLLNNMNPPTPSVACSTCQTATSITITWQHDAKAAFGSAAAPSAYYKLRYRPLRPAGSEAEWKEREVRTWTDVVIQETIGCCTGCEDPMQHICSADNLEASTVYEIQAQSVDERLRVDSAWSKSLEAPTGQDARTMPIGPETFCSLLSICAPLSFSNDGFYTQFVTEDQDVLEMRSGFHGAKVDRFAEDHEAKGMVVSSLSSGSPSSMVVVLSTARHIDTQSLQPMPERPTEEYLEMRAVGGAFFTAVAASQSTSTGVQWIMATSKGVGLASQRFSSSTNMVWMSTFAPVQASRANGNAPHYVTQIASSGEEWVVVASRGMCAPKPCDLPLNTGDEEVDTANKVECERLAEKKECSQIILRSQGKFPHDQWDRHYNEGYRLTSLVHAPTRGLGSTAGTWVLAAHKNSGIGMQKIITVPNYIEDDSASGFPSYNPAAPALAEYKRAGYRISGAAGHPDEGWKVVLSRPATFGPPCLKICANGGVLNDQNCTCSCPKPWYGDTNYGQKNGTGCTMRPEPCVLSDFGPYDNECPVVCSGQWKRRRRTILREPSVAPFPFAPQHNGESCAVVNCKMNRASFVDRSNVNSPSSLERPFLFTSFVASGYAGPVAQELLKKESTGLEWYRPPSSLPEDYFKGKFDMDQANLARKNAANTLSVAAQEAGAASAMVNAIANNVSLKGLYYHDDVGRWFFDYMQFLDCHGNSTSVGLPWSPGALQSEGTVVNEEDVGSSAPALPSEGAGAAGGDDETKSWKTNALCKVPRHREVKVCESMTSDSVRAADQICSQKRVAHIFDRDTDDKCYLDYKQMNKCNDVICNGAPIISIKVRSWKISAYMTVVMRAVCGISIFPSPD